MTDPRLAPLVERLATSCVALRENWVYTGDGQRVRLGVQADEMEEAAIRIADLLWVLEAVKHGAEYPDELGDLIDAAIAKASGASE